MTTSKGIFSLLIVVALLSLLGYNYFIYEKINCTRGCDSVEREVVYLKRELSRLKEAHHRCINSEKTAATNTNLTVGVLAVHSWTSKTITDSERVCSSVIDKEVKPAINSSMTCHLPQIDPFNPTIMKLISDKADPRCSGTPHGELVDGVFKFKDPANIESATYKAITRSGDFHEKLGDSFKLLNNANIADEFIEVEFVLKGGHDQTEHFIQAVPRANLLERKPSKTAGIPLNILILGIDSLSHGNARRKLPKLYEYLRDDLNAFIFQGHSVVGDGTTEQLTAMLAGTRVLEQPEARPNFPNSGMVDRWSLIYKELVDHGYITGFSEDSIVDGAFQYRLKGFDKQPTDLYSRPFFERARKFQSRREPELCLHSRSITQYQLDYVRSMFRRLPEKLLKFFFLFSDGYSHHKINDVQKLQTGFLNLLKEFKTEGRLNNTMVIAMGDHGLRYGKIRTTVQGKLEERLPLFAVALPPSFERQYPKLAANLRVNTERLTSWFDVYATFRHLLSYPDLPKDLKHGQSLFTEIPATRKCGDASLEDHWCPCLQWTAVDASHAHLRKAAEATIEYMNYLNTKNEKIAKFCEKLSLKEVNNGFLERPHKKLLSFSAVDGKWNEKFGGDHKTRQDHSCNYQVQFVTSPSNAVYEATVKFAKNAFTVSTDVSRLNAYGDQPKCIAKQYPHLRKFCQCKNETIS